MIRCRAKIKYDPERRIGLLHKEENRLKEIEIYLEKMGYSFSGSYEERYRKVKELCKTGDSVMQRFYRGLNQYHYWMVAECDWEISRYYRYWLSKVGIYISSPNKKPHISVIRGLDDMTGDLTKWGFRDGKTIDFFYDPDMDEYPAYYTEPGTHYSLRVYSDELDDIRNHYGLKEMKYHITIGRTYDFRET